MASNKYDNTYFSDKHALDNCDTAGSTRQILMAIFPPSCDIERSCCIPSHREAFERLGTLLSQFKPNIVIANKLNECDIAFIGEAYCNFINYVLSNILNSKKTDSPHSCLTRNTGIFCLLYTSPSTRD